jgi:hypothetical protein
MRIQLNAALALGRHQVGEPGGAAMRATRGRDDASIRAGLVWDVRFVDHPSTMKAIKTAVSLGWDIRYTGKPAR